MHSGVSFWASFMDEPTGNLFITAASNGINKSPKLAESEAGASSHF